MLVDRRQRETQLSAAEHVRERTPSAVRVRSENFPAEHATEMLEWFYVPAMDLEFQGRLLFVAGERSFTDDETHGVSEPELIHGSNISIVSPRHKVVRATLVWRFRPAKKVV